MVLDFIETATMVSLGTCCGVVGKAVWAVPVLSTRVPLVSEVWVVVERLLPGGVGDGKEG